MTVATYIALRSVQMGHTVGVTYSIALPTVILDRSTKTVGSESVSLSGIPQNIIDRRDVLWNVSTLQLASGTQQYLDVEEFLESVDGKEYFSMDFEGSLAAPDETVSCILTSNYSRQRVDQTNEFVFSFTLRVIP